MTATVNDEKKRKSIVLSSLPEFSAGYRRNIKYFIQEIVLL
jgi:hypothetical protein